METMIVFSAQSSSCSLQSTRNMQQKTAKMNRASIQLTSICRTSILKHGSLYISAGLCEGLLCDHSRPYGTAGNRSGRQIIASNDETVWLARSMKDGKELLLN